MAYIIFPNKKPEEFQKTFYMEDKQKHLGNSDQVIDKACEVVKPKNGSIQEVLTR